MSVISDFERLGAGVKNCAGFAKNIKPTTVGARMALDAARKALDAAFNSLKDAHVQEKQPKPETQPEAGEKPAGKAPAIKTGPSDDERIAKAFASVVKTSRQKR